ncbi:MAG: ORF6N domain-containing protein [bacterium]
MKDIVPQGRIERMILFIRGQKVVLDKDLAALYCVPTKVLNQAVKRNRDRFPESFVFRLNEAEAERVVRLRSQFVTLKRGQHSKYLPYAFTEHGLLMAANVLNSKQAITVSIRIVETFIRLRAWLMTHKEFAKRLDEMEKKYDAQFKVVFDAIRELMTPPEKPRRHIGFHVESG